MCDQVLFLGATFARFFVAYPIAAGIDLVQRGGHKPVRYPHTVRMNHEHL